MDGLEQIKDFLIWARGEGVFVTKIKTAGIELELDALEPVPAQAGQSHADAKWDPPQAPPLPTIYEEFAKQLGLDDETAVETIPQ